MRKIISNQIYSNVIYAFIAQFISLVFSILMTFIVSKFIGVEEFGYWQLFIFYTNYISFFGLGIYDGNYLKLGGKEYEELDYSIIGVKFKIFSLTQSVVAFFLIIVFYFSVKDTDRYFVLLCFSLYLVVYNICAFLGYIFQAVNHTKIYSISIIIDKVLYIIITAVLIFYRVNNFELYILFYLICKLISLIYSIIKGHKIVFAKKSSVKIAIVDLIDDMKVGINIMIANIASLLIIGSGRFVIDHYWTILEFSKFSFSISLTNFFLVFISQISMVLFPALRRIKEDQLVSIYVEVKSMLAIILPIALLMYVPINAIVKVWLPQYQVSAKYLILLLPICIFDGKMQLICNTYLKVLRKERFLKIVNIVAMVVSLLLSLISACVFGKIELVAISMMIAIASRNILADIYLAKYMRTDTKKEIISEIILVIMFVILTWNFEGIIAFLSYLATYLIYCLINKNMTRRAVSFISGLIS